MSEMANCDIGKFLKIIIFGFRVGGTVAVKGNGFIQSLPHNSALQVVVSGYKAIVVENSFLKRFPV